MTVRVRFAPSPTGEPHIGNIRTVVFNWLFARQNQGKFVLRIEDTDRTRYVEKALQVITDGLRWLGMDWDEGPGVGGDYRAVCPVRASGHLPRESRRTARPGARLPLQLFPERLDAVREAQRARGETPMYDGHCRDKAPGEVSPDEPHVIRLKVPREGTTVMHDILRGDIVFENRLLDDQILLKSDGFPTYHLAVVIDDHMMGITHIMRGDDWISSTPKRLLMYEAFGWQPPIYAHVPLVLGTDGKKLGKRHGAVSIAEFRRQGYLPEALFNFLALLGWAPGGGEEQEIFTREELIARFDITHINLAPAVFSYDKLNWINGQYIRALSHDELLERLIPFWEDAGLIPTPRPAELLPTLKLLVPLVQERLKTLRDVVELTDFVFCDIDIPPVEALIGKKMTAEQSLEAIRRVQALLAGLLALRSRNDGRADAPPRRGTGPEGRATVQHRAQRRHRQGSLPAALWQHRGARTGQDAQTFGACGRGFGGAYQGAKGRGVTHLYLPR